VRALKSDYADLLDIDDESGEIDKKSIEKALKAIKNAEPNLFKKGSGKAKDDDVDDEDIDIDIDEDENEDDEDNSFKGKKPGGGSSTSKKIKDFDKKKAEALEMIGIVKKEAGGK
jgi:hypothetical protein